MNGRELDRLELGERVDRALNFQHVSVLGYCINCGARCPNGRCPYRDWQRLRK